MIIFTEMCPGKEIGRGEPHHGEDLRPYFLQPMISSIRSISLLGLNGLTI
jgi:hypothetical protein